MRRSIFVIAWSVIAVMVPADLGAEEFYKDKTINLVVGYSTGGGYDLYARLLARHYGRHIAGHPNIIVQNMPGASSLTAVRYLEAAAPKDGTFLTTFDPGQITVSFAMPEKMKLKFSDFQWVGAIVNDHRVCYAWGASGIKTWDDMMKRKEFLVGATAKGSSNYIYGAVLRNLFHAPIRQVTGYPGSAEQRLAIERGELEGACAPWSAVPEDWIRENKINPIVNFSPTRAAGALENVPFIGEFTTTQEQKTLLGILSAAGVLERPYILSKEVPADRVKTLRAAFDATMTDKAFLADAEKQNLPVNPTGGAEAGKIIAAVYASPAELAARTRDVIE